MCGRHVVVADTRSALQCVRRGVSGAALLPSSLPTPSTTPPSCAPAEGDRGGDAAAAVGETGSRPASPAPHSRAESEDDDDDHCLPLPTSCWPRVGEGVRGAHVTSSLSPSPLDDPPMRLFSRLVDLVVCDTLECTVVSAFAAAAVDEMYSCMSLPTEADTGATDERHMTHTSEEEEHEQKEEAGAETTAVWEMSVATVIGRALGGSRALRERLRGLRRAITGAHFTERHSATAQFPRHRPPVNHTGIIPLPLNDGGPRKRGGGGGSVPRSPTLTTAPFALASSEKRDIVTGSGGGANNTEGGAPSRTDCVVAAPFAGTAPPFPPPSFTSSSATMTRCEDEEVWQWTVGGDTGTTAPAEVGEGRRR